MAQYLPFIQVFVAIILIVLILLQQRGTALGAGFGGDSGFYATRRGIQQKIFLATIVFGTLFILLALFSLVLS